MGFDEVKRKRIVSRGNRRVRGEDGGATNFVQRALEIRARFAQIADALQHDEGGVPFVQVIDAGL